jgi:hypothetical protein
MRKNYLATLLVLFGLSACASNDNMEKEAMNYDGQREYNEGDQADSFNAPNALEALAEEPLENVEMMHAPAMLIKAQAADQANRYALQKILNSSVNVMSKEELSNAITRTHMTIETKLGKLDRNRQRRILQHLLGGVVASMKPKEVEAALKSGLEEADPAIINGIIAPAAGGYYGDYNPYGFNQEYDLEF